MSILALSLPISVILILGILTAGNTFTQIHNILILGGSLCAVGIVYPVYLKATTKFALPKNEAKSSKKNTVEFVADK